MLIHVIPKTLPVPPHFLIPAENSTSLWIPRAATDLAKQINFLLIRDTISQLQAGAGDEITIMGWKILL